MSRSIDGQCERCGAEVVRRLLTQWYFKITEYADRLLADMGQLEGKWPERVLLMQRNWIGRCEGAEVQFAIEGRDEPVTVFTTRPDTLYGATFFVVAADSPLAAELCAPEQREALDAYLAQVRKLTDIERQATDRPKTGVFLGRYAINPVNGERIPVWAADYVLPDYGTGAIMAVPAHDQRDLDFAREFGLPVRVVVETGEPDPAETGIGDARRRQAGQLRAAGRAEQGRRDRGRSPAILAAQGPGTGRGQLPAARLAAVPAAVLGHADPDRVLRRLRRGSGAGRPAAGGAARPARPGPGAQGGLAAGGGRGLGRTPSARSAAARPGGTPTRWTRSWTPRGTSCATARRDTPTGRSTWSRCAAGARSTCTSAASSTRSCTCCTAGSSSRSCTTWAWSTSPSRSPRLINQGQVINQGRAMSKSLGNGVDLGEQLAAHGVDAIRLTMIFASPPEDDIDWADMRPEASVKFLGRAMADRRRRRAVPCRRDAGRTATCELRKVTHRTIDEVTRLVEAARLNVAVARLMELATAARRAIDCGPGAADPAVREAAETLAVLLSLFAPVHRRGVLGAAGPPAVGGNGRLAARRSCAAGEDLVTCVVQVDGKVRDRLEVPPGIGEDELRELALAAPGVARALAGGASAR